MYSQIVFMTSNRTKLAHIRYIGKDLSIPINLFHEETYHASYDEPRIYNRDQLLEKSVESAIEQIKKAKIYSNKRLFLIEDTSVIIKALSDDENEVPGLDVKYWMKNTSFKDLNLQLTKAGNRSVTVRSDIILFNFDKSIYEHFTGFSHGNVVENEHPIKTHLLYPWLDDKTFNKWFIPLGEHVPISLLPIEKANLVDFRRKAFEQVMEYISKNNLINKVQHQPSLFQTRRLLIVVGYSCAGKTSVAQYASHKFNVRHLEASDFMRLAFSEIHGLGSRYNIEEFAKISLKYKPEIVAEKIISDLDDFKHQTDVLVTGFRSPKEAEFLKEQLSDQYEINIIKISADFETRYKRALERKRPGDSIKNKQKFRDKDKVQLEMGIDDFLGYSIENIGELVGFYKRFDFFNSQKKLIEKPQQNISIKFGGLKLSVLLFLKEHYDVNGQGQFFSTTDISKEIEHHKDNISRFFNQTLSADFETLLENNIVKYRLSNTGFSKINLFEKVQD